VDEMQKESGLTMSEESEVTCISNSSSQSNASSIYTVKAIQSVGISQRRCTICQSVKVWLEKQILIPLGNRTCSIHLSHLRFTPEALQSIEATKEEAKLTGRELGQWMLMVTDDLTSTKPMNGLLDGKMKLDEYKKFFGIGKEDFEDLFKAFVENSAMRNTACRHKKEALGMLLMMLSKNLAQETVGFIFCCSQSVVSDAIDAVSTTLTATLVKSHLGYEALSRSKALVKHNRSILRDVLKIEANQLAVIADGTYIYVEQPSDHRIQRQRLTQDRKVVIL